MRSFWVIFLLFAITHLSAEENFILFGDGVVYEMGPRVHERVTPCCTFKIALCLMGFDSGVLKGLEKPTWPYQQRDLAYIGDWAMDQNPQSWMKNSCIWYSQLLAAKLGPRRMVSYLQLFDYGNQNCFGGPTFWLSSALKISPREQVSFLQKFLHDRLPVTPRAAAITKSLLFLEEWEGGGKLYGMTGLSDQVGWFVGWVEKEEKLLIFAYNIIENNIDPSQRIPRVKELLADFLSDNILRSGEEAQ